MYFHQEDKKTLKKFFCSVRGNDFKYENTQRDGSFSTSIRLLGGMVRLLDARLLDKTGLEILVVPGVSETRFMTSAEIKSHEDRKHYCFYVDTPEEANAWISVLMRCTLPFQFLKAFEFNGSQEHLRVASVLPKVKEMPSPYRRALVWSKIRLMALHFDFSREAESSYREAKRSTLLELLDVVDTLPELLNDACIFQEMMQGVELALLRPTPSEVPVAMTSDDEELPYSDPEWSHLSLVYDVLMHVVLSVRIESAIRKHYIGSTFINRLIALFDSPDPQEREYLKMVTHRIYGKLTNRRAAIRRAINQTFYTFLYETRHHYGISVLLEILASIINGFTLPIRPEHRQSLEKALIPLHKMSQYEEYSVQLSYCMALYVEKDRSLSAPIVRGLLRYWPTGNSAKEILFLNELEDLMKQLGPGDLVPYREALFRRLAKCLRSCHLQVAERVLFLFSANTFDGLVTRDPGNLQVLLPLVYPPLRDCEAKATNENLRQIATHVIGVFSDADMALTQQLAEKYDSECS